MLVIEILMVIIGIGAVVVSFRLSDDDKEPSEIKADIDSEEIKLKISQAVKETKEEILSKADEKFSQISNDKILGFSEYSQEVFSKIEKNHEETVFLYNMLTEKEKEIQKLIHSVDVTNADLRNESAKAYQKIKNQLSQVDDVLKQLEVKSIKDVHVKEESVNYDILRDREEEKKKDFTEFQREPVKRDNDISLSQMSQRRKNIVLDEEEVKAIAEITDPGRKYAIPEESIFEDSKPEENKLNSNSEIIALYKKGRSVLEISKMLSMGQGEVKLVIDLYNAR